MRSDYPDYKTPLFATFRAIGVLTVVCVIGAAICILLRASTWVVNGLFIAFGVSGLIIAVVAQLGVLRAEDRARSARSGKRATSNVTAAPRRWVVAARLLIFVCGILGLPLRSPPVLVHPT